MVRPYVLAQALLSVVVGAAVIALVLAGSWELADSAGVSARLSLLVAAVATMAACALGLPQVARRRPGTQLETGPVELGLLSGVALGVVVGGAVVIFGLR